MCYVVVEGIDGSGKTAQINRLFEYLSGHLGFKVLVVREPGGTPLGDVLRNILLNRLDLRVGVNAEVLLFNAARSQLIGDVIRPALHQGKFVVSDRSFLSTLAYQGYGRGMDITQLLAICDFATGRIIPDLVIYLDVPPKVGIARKKRAKLDRIDNKSLEFYNRVRQGYLALANANPEKWTVINGNAQPDIVFQEILRAIHERLGIQVR